MRVMFMKWCATVLLLAAHVRAQETGAISGTVFDAASGRLLIGCSIRIESMNIGAASDGEGQFRLEHVPYGKIVLLASYVGYKDRRLQFELSHADLHIQIRLETSPIIFPAITTLATRATERETPVAFATLAQDDVRARYHAQDLPVLLSELPSTNFYSESGNGLGYNYLSIRGFDQRRISVLINGVPQNDPEDHNVYWIDFPDLLGNTADVQVQRGAGSAFYGPPAIGGSVNVITAAPATEHTLTAYLGAGNYGTKKYSLAWNSGALAKKFFLFGRVSRIQSEGYRERSWVDLKSYFLGAAATSQNSVTRLHVYGGPIEDHLAYYGVSKTQALQRETRRANPIRRSDEIENFNQPQLQLLHEYAISKKVRVLNTLFAMRGNGFFDYDGSWAPLAYFRLTPEYGFAVAGNPEEVFVDSLLIRAQVDNRQLGWLPQITYEHTRGKLTFGAELRRHRSWHWGRIQDGATELPEALAGEYSGRSYIGRRHYYEYRGAKDIASTYAHAIYYLHPKLNTMFDLQYVYLRYRLYDEKFLGTNFSRPYHFLNPRLGLNYNATERFNLFAGFARTAREPRLKNFYDAAEASTPASWGAVEPQFETQPHGAFDFNRPLVRPEKLHDYELGLGYRAEHAQVLMNLFYMDFKDEIIKSGRLDRFGQPVTGNAERTLHTGLELQAAAQLMPALHVT
ncbi:MAG: TonB-dependent receptor, partial [candidate division KSB1 bacterium]